MKPTTTTSLSILWIHGFAGRANNDIVQCMRKHYPEHVFHSIEVDHHAISSMEKINTFIKDNKTDLVAGTSLGGFYAMCAGFDGPKFVINPVTDPQKDLAQFLGENTYKPGREDGQTTFIFTEQLLKLFGELEIGSLSKNICHYTAHDQVLGEGIKDNYNDLFYYLKQIDEKVLPSHFLTHKYIKKDFGEELKKITEESLEINLPNPNTIFQDHTLRELTRLRYSNLNTEKAIKDIEKGISSLYKQKNKVIIRELLFARKRIKNHYFELNEEHLKELSAINETLRKHTHAIKEKIEKEYRHWLEDSEEEWSKDAEIEGTITLWGDKFFDDFTDQEQRPILDICFSLPIDSEAYEYVMRGMTSEIPFLRGEKSNPNNFMMCEAFENLTDSYFALEDILRLDQF